MRNLGGTTLLALGAALVWGCGDEPVVTGDGPPPVSGGTLLVTGDERYAIASDPDRGQIHVVDLARREAMHHIELEAGDEPGRSVEGLDGRVHVVLRNAGEIMTIEPASARVVARERVCTTPRGIDVEPDTGDVVVACAEGVLVRVRESGEHVTTVLEPDLRDVVARGGDRFYVSRFRSAELLVVSAGTIVERMRPPEAAVSFASAQQVPTVAWRLREHGDGVMMVHQLSTSTQLGTLGVPSGVYYGGDCTSGVVRSAVTIFNAGSAPRTAAISNASLVVDAASSGAQLHFAAASEPGNLVPVYGLRTMDASAFGSTASCAVTSDPYPDRPSAAVAVEVTASGARIVQYRDPAVLRFDDGSGPTDIVLSDERVQHLGYALFHEAAGSGATCASCHPEGGDDGHVWLFDTGAKRTQSLRGGILQTAPFHWAGDVADVTAVMSGTFVGRMGGEMPRGYELESFGTWLDALPAVPGPATEVAAVERGRGVFDSAGCDDCHSGDRGTNNATTDVGTGGAFQVPMLVEVAYRAPYLHDGSATTIGDVLFMHGDTPFLSEADRLDLEAYLRSR